MSDSATSDTGMPQQSELFYQAIGTVEGILQQDGDNWSLSIGEQTFGVWLKRKHQLLKHIQPKTVQRFRVYPRHGPHRGLYFTVIMVMPMDEALGFTLRGCWVRPSYDTKRTCLIVHRNERRSDLDKAKSVHMPLSWEDAPEPDGQFWIVSAQLEGTELLVTEAQGPFPPPLNWFQKERQETSDQNARKSQVTRPKLESQVQSGKASSVASASPQIDPPLTAQEIRSMAIATKIQVTCKISEVPPHREVNKLVEFFLEEGDRVLTVRVKPKQFKKLTDHGHDQWVAAIVGALGSATETGFELANASIQVFEKKAKASGNKEGKVKAKFSDATGKTSQVSPPKPLDRGEKPPKKQRLIDSVRIG